MKKAQAISSIAFGFFIGCLVSILPLPLNLIALVAFYIYFLAALCLSSSHRKQRFLAVGTTAVVVAIAICLPVKQLDRSVGPIHYAPTPFNQLTDKLRNDWSIYVMPDFSNPDESLAAFDTSVPMSRRRVLEKLAHDTGRELHVGYCGTGATFLFGAHPSFTRLTKSSSNDVETASQSLHPRSAP